MQDNDQYQRPDGMSDQLVEAVGKLSEAFEYIERVRGKIYDMHQLAGHADLLFGDAADKLKQAGALEAAELVSSQVVGRNVIDGRWTFQLVDEFNRAYYQTVKEVVEDVEKQLQDGKKHIFEAEMKQDRITGKDQGSHKSRP